MSSLAKESLEKFIGDGFYIQVVEDVDNKPVYRGKNFNLAWSAVQEYKSVLIEVYRSTKLFIGYVFVDLESNYFEFSGDYPLLVFNELKTRF